ncbi:MAG: hypothetical protein ABIQ40_05360 [Bacteroidia bacterium]
MKNSIFIELGGNGAQFGGLVYGTVSIFYDRIVLSSEFMKASVRIGGTIPRHEAYQAFPLLFNVLFGRNNFFFETGLGCELLYVRPNYNIAYGAFTSAIGLRYQNPKGLIARIAITPTIANKNRDPFYYVGALIGISLGYSF